jgi:serine/threonine protein phosphatase PrpC
MSSSSDSGSSKTGGLLARLRGMMQALTAGDSPPLEETLPTWDVPAGSGLPASPLSENPPLAMPVPESEQVASPAMAVPVSPLTQPPDALVKEDRATGTTPTPEPPPLLAGETPTEPTTLEFPPVPPRLCSACQAVRGADIYCDSCGFLFPPEENVRTNDDPPRGTTPGPRLMGRFEMAAKLGERCGIERFRGLDHGGGSDQPIPVIIVRAPLTKEKAAEKPTQDADLDNPQREEEIIPAFDAPLSQMPATDPLLPIPSWPAVRWERNLLEIANHAALPKNLASFVEEGYEYLVEEIPIGRSLWDAWDDPDAGADRRFGWLRQIAEALQALHQGGVILEALRPDIIVIDADDKARLTDLSDLLPLPLPADAPLRATFYTPPELTSGQKVDERADLYGFGAMLYALHVGRELTEMDFERPGFPKPFIPRFPDIHPLFGRLITKTFRRELTARFPTEETTAEDPTGFAELIRNLDVCAQTFDEVRLDVASWTTTGIVRSGNEDAFALCHVTESRLDYIRESALILLADGMGGYESGEVAAALAIHSLRKYLFAQACFQSLSGVSPFPGEAHRFEGHSVPETDIDSCKDAILAALKYANKEVHSASRSGVGKRGMGCTAEVVYITGKHVIVGHVGDSRTYHLNEGRLVQLTRDHTLVGRLVELGTLTAEEAERHPRKNELQQAIGGRADVEPGLYQGFMKPGDWVVVCSDGLPNHVSALMLKQMLQSEATSAEMAARRLVNLVNVEGATDNATVVVARAT